MSKKITHTGIIRNADGRTVNNSRKVLLAESRSMWIANNGVHYQKNDGYPNTEDFPLYRLDLASIEKMSEMNWWQWFCHWLNTPVIP